jgi:hypothetical protein
LSLCFCSLNKIKSHIKHQIWQEPEENLLEIVVLSSQTQIFESFNYKVADSLLIEQLLKIGPLSKNYQRLNHHRNQVGESVQDLVLILRDITFAHFIFFLEKEVNTLQTLSFELIDNIVQNLQTGDVDHTVVIWRIRNQNSNTENPNENGGKMWACYKRVICTLKLSFSRHFLKHSKNHSDEASNHINFLHDVSNKWIFPSKMKLIDLEGVVQAQNICVE